MDKLQPLQVRLQFHREDRVAQDQSVPLLLDRLCGRCSRIHFAVGYPSAQPGQAALPKEPFPSLSRLAGCGFRSVVGAEGQVRLGRALQKCFEDLLCYYHTSIFDGVIHRTGKSKAIIPVTQWRPQPSGSGRGAEIVQCYIRIRGASGTTAPIAPGPFSADPMDMLTNCARQL